MRDERLIATAGPDGKVRFEIAGLPGRVYEVAVSVDETPGVGGAGRIPTPEELGWPPGFFERFCGSITDDSFVAPRRLPAEPVSPLDCDDDSDS